MRIILSGGGTGGHVIPNIAVIEELRKKSGIDILYIGSKEGVEKKMIEKLGIRYEGIRCGKLRRYFSIENFLDFFRTPVGIVEAYKKLKSFSPDVLFSKGGYVSVPVVMAARILRIPIIVHESDVSPGLANKICFKFAKKICLSFEETRAYLSEKNARKALITGNPIRDSVLSGDKERGYKFTKLDKHRPVILVMGGSQGARQINELIRVSLDEILKRFQVVHITGKGNLDISVHKKGYVQYEYLDLELKDIYAMCDLVITRGGANSLYELALLNKKVLIIPLTLDASRGEQVKNAQVFIKKFGWSMNSGDITREDFIDNINILNNSETRSEEILKNGTKKIVELLLSYSK